MPAAAFIVLPSVDDCESHGELVNPPSLKVCRLERYVVVLSALVNPPLVINLAANFRVLHGFCRALKTMMKDIEHFLEDSPHRDIKLNEVFNKITDILQQQTVVSPSKQKMSCDVIETILPERSNIPICQGLVSSEDLEDNAACQALAVRLEEQLRAAKTAQLACGEVLLPADLLPRVARDVLRMAENEPCGLRGCTLYVNFESEQECRKIGTVKCDPNTVSTFELFLTLRRDSRSTWTSLIPQFIKNFTKGGTIMISPGFTLEKKKLYRSFVSE